MERDDKRIRYRRHNDHAIVGLILLGAGVLLLAQRMGAAIPDWVFSWQMLLIVIGLMIGAKSNFKNPGWVITFAVGGFFLVDEIMPGTNLHNFIWPAILITIGATFLFRPKSNWKHDKRWQQWRQPYEDAMQHPDLTAKDFTASANDGEFIDATSVFGGVKKLILSKNFRGGDITCFMGGAEIDLTQADIQGTAVIDITAVFGGAKLVVPANWNVKTEITAVFGGTDDKRKITTVMPDTNKTLVLAGTAVFGGIEINSY